MLLCPYLFEGSKCDNIKALKYVCAVWWVTQNDYVLHNGILNEAHSVVQVVPIQEKELRLTLVLCLCLLIKILQPCQADLTICPALVRDQKADRLSVLDSKMQCAKYSLHIQCVVHLGPC